MRIGIDCRKVADYGIGTYVRGLTHALAELPGGEHYVLFSPADRRHLLPRGGRFTWIEEQAPNYSFRELIALGRHRVDLFHAPHYVVPAGRATLAVTIHDLIHLNQPRRNLLERLYAEVMIARAVRRSAVIFTVSAAVREEIAARYPGAEERIIVTPNGVGEEFRPLDVPECGSYFLFVGNDKPHKNLSTLLAAFVLVRKKLPGVELVLAGGATATGDGIIARGFVPEAALPDLYRRAIALVQPSIEEGFGLPLLEAMACGTPVIASRAAALMEVAGGAALHVEASDAAAMAEAMLRIENDSSLRASLRDRGVVRAASFSWRKCAEETLRGYRRAWNNVEQTKS
jgi:glycosyltransferase involved in cell wall biosynthesis